MKKIITMLVVGISLFGFVNCVQAKECEYYRNAVLGPSENISVTVDMSGNKPNAVIKNYYKKYGMTNDENIQNWSDISSTYNETSTCPTYILVTKSMSGYNVYLSYEESTLNEIATKKGLLIGSEKAIMTHCSNEYTPPAVNENFYKNIEEKTAIILSAAEKFNIEDCKDNDKIITRISDCRSDYNSSNMFLRSSESEVRGLIASGDISADDPRVIAFFEAIEKAKSKWAQAEKLLAEEQRKIDEEMRINPIEEDSTKASWWDSADGNTEALAKKIYSMIKIIVPLLVIVLSIANYLKVLFVSEEKNYKAAFNKFIKRISVGIILFLLPVLISLILNIAGLDDMGGIISIFS